MHAQIITYVLFNIHLKKYILILVVIIFLIKNYCIYIIYNDLDDNK